MQALKEALHGLEYTNSEQELYRCGNERNTGIVSYRTDNKEPPKFSNRARVNPNDAAPPS